MGGDTIKTEQVDADANAVSTLKGLLKANEDNGAGTLLQKAKDKDKGKDKDDDKDDEYSEAYMKNNMSKFMKNNASYMKKMGYMQKAVDNAYEAADNGGELEAEVTMVDGTEMFKAFKEMSEHFLKAVTSISERLDGVEEQVDFANKISVAAGEVLVKASESLDKISSEPLTPKSQMVGQPELHKAAIKDVPADGNQVLQKAMNMGVGGAKKILIKAAMDGNGEAGRVLTQVESCFGNMTLLPASSLKLIASLTD